MAKNPFSVSPEEMQRLRQTYQGRTTKPTDMRTFKVDARPRAKPQPKLETAPMPSSSSVAQSVLGMLRSAPEGIADLAVSIPSAAYDYVRTSTPGDVASDIKSGVGRFADYFSSNPLEALMEVSPAGTAKEAGLMLREASLARDAGDEERALQIEKFAVPMMLASLVPGGRAAKGAERMAVREGVEAAEQAAGLPKRRGRYQPVEPVAEPHPELKDISFPEGSGRGGNFAVENKVPIVGRRPFVAQSPGGYSRLAGGLPANQVTVETQPFIEMAERQFIDPHDLVKDFRAIVPFIGDKLRGGEDILSVAGRPQEGAARAFSGPDFARQQIGAGGNEVWASGPSVISAIDRMAKDAQDRFGGRVAGVYTAMGPEGADQTTAMMDLIGRQISAGDISPRDKEAFDDLIRTASRKDDEPIPDFVGFANDPRAAVEQLNDINNITMGQRRTLTQAMNAKPWLEAGFPDIGANRAGLTIPELLYAPEGTSGYSISALDPGKGALPDEAVSMKHPNYSKKLGGTYLGGFEVGVPRELVWSQLYGRPEMQRYEPFRQLSYLFGRPPREIRADLGYDPRIQPIDEEWADRIAEYIQAVKKYGAEPYAEGGLAAGG